MAKGDFKKEFKTAVAPKRLAAAVGVGLAFGGICSLAMHFAGPAAAAGLMTAFGAGTTIGLLPTRKNPPPQNPPTPPVPEAPKA